MKKKVKSSLELALEKVESEDNKEKPQENFKLKQYEKAAEALARSFLEGVIEKEQVSERIGRYPQEVQKKAILAFLKEAVSHLKLDSWKPLMDLSLELCGDDKELNAIAADLLQICRDFQEKKETLLIQEGGKAREKMAHKLAEEGYRGSAIADFNLRASPVWAQTETGLQKEFSRSLSRRLQEAEHHGGGSPDNLK